MTSLLAIHIHIYVMLHEPNERQKRQYSVSAVPEISSEDIFTTFSLNDSDDDLDMPNIQPDHIKYEYP